MKFSFSVLLSISLLFCSCATAQVSSDSASRANRITAWFSAKQTKTDSLIVNRYLNDTLGYIAFHNGSLLDSLIPNSEVVNWELNEISNDHPWGVHGIDLAKNAKGFRKLCKGCENTYHDWLNKFRYESVYRSGNKKIGLSDSNVLTKGHQGFDFSNPLRSSGKWYISAQKRNGKLLHIDTNKKLGHFVKNAENPYNAFFLLTYLMSEPLFTSPDCKYKAVKNGYLIMIADRVDDCPVIYTDLLFFINKNKNYVFIKLLRIRNEKGCI